MVITCPVCDVMHRLDADRMAKRTRCVNCGYRLTLGRPEAITRVVGLSLSSTILMGMVVFLPFLQLQAGTFSNSASVFDAILGFSDGLMVPLSIAVLGFIIVLPTLRSLLLIYALGPMALQLRNLPSAEAALRWAFALKPWAMAEIFMVGVAVALVKLAGMARIDMGAAFWAFGLLVLINAYSDTFMCRNTLWTGLAANRR